MLTDETTAAIRALAERRVPCPGEHPPMLRWHHTCEHCGEPIDRPSGTVPDPAYAAIVDRAVDHPDDIAANRHLRTDLEACLTVAAAHGLSIDFDPPGDGDRLWWCRMWKTTALVCRGQADNPTEAAWRAFLAWEKGRQV